MRKDININQINDKVKLYIEKYLDTKYSNQQLKEMPDLEEVENMVIDIRKQLIKKNPELTEILSVGSTGDVQVSYYGCSGFLWGLLTGALLCRCGRCKCGRGCRWGRGCRRRC